MNNEKSIEEIATAINKKINMTLLTELPLPSCPIKRQRVEWRREQVLVKIINTLQTHDKSGAAAI